MIENQDMQKLQPSICMLLAPGILFDFTNFESNSLAQFFCDLSVDK